MPRPERLSIPIPSQIEDPSFDENAYLVTEIAAALAIDPALVTVVYDTDTETWLASAGIDVYAFPVNSDDNTYAFALVR